MKSIALAKIAAVSAAAAAMFGMAIPAAAAESSVSTVYADMDGNGTLDRVTSRAFGEQQQLLKAWVGGHYYETVMRMETFGAVPPLRVTHLGDDGRAEVVVTEVEGANTTHMAVMDIDSSGWRLLVTPEPQPFALYEGGGISAYSRYTCEDTANGRELVTISAQWDENATDDVTYSGTRTNHRVVDGVATPMQVTQIVKETRDAAVMQADPNAC